MSAPPGNDDFYQNILRYINQNTTTTSAAFSSPTTTIAQVPFAPLETEMHSRDEPMTEANDAKRRVESPGSPPLESGADESNALSGKPRKKPGRKMMMTEPANKRKAQNRAAQRAFRERKEAHVKGLESRVSELEELTQTKDAENAILKSQLQALQVEVAALRGGNFNFDFSLKTVPNPNILTNNNGVRNPFQQNGQTNVQQAPSPSSGSITDSSFFRSGQSSLATSPENDANKNATPNIDIPFDLFANNTAGPAKFTNTSNHTSPLFSPDLFGSSSTTNTSPPLFNQNQAQSTASVLDTFASTLASLASAQSPRSLSSGFATTVPSTTSSAPLSAFTPNSTANLFDMNDPLFTTWRDSSISSNDDSGFDIFDTMFASMSPGAFNLVDPTDLTQFITDSPIALPNVQTHSAGEKQVTCPELWERVKSLPNFDDIDIDQLCAEMRSKAKCSNSGALISPRDVDETISRFVKPEPLNG